MKSLIVITALIMGVTAPAFAENFLAPGFANETAVKIFREAALSEGNGAERQLAGPIADASVGERFVTASRGDARNDVATAMFDAAARASDDGAERQKIGRPSTLLAGNVVNAEAARIFAEFAASD